MPGDVPTVVRMTPGAPVSGGAVSILHVHADAAEMMGLCERIGVGPVGVGKVVVRDLCGVDRGVACLIAPGVLQLMPHAGVAVERTLLARLTELGATLADPSRFHPRDLYPEAADDAEACALDALSRAVSPRAVDAVLASAEAWRRAGPANDPARERALDRLLVAPTVAAVGRANVGKSTLLNALARQALAVVSEHAGTTLDHVGAALCLDGVVVQWIDTPGWRVDAGALELEARASAAEAVARADLVVVCVDAASGGIDPGLMGARDGTAMLRVGTRGSLGEVGGCDMVTDAHEGRGIAELAVLVRRALVPDGVLEAPGRWAFHPILRG